MAKLTTQDLDGIRSAQKERLAFSDKTYMLICGGTGCHATGSIRVKDALLAAIEEKGLSQTVEVIETGCNGFCAVGPVMLVQPEGIFYQKLSVEDVPELVEEHFLKGRPVPRLFFKEHKSKEKIPHIDDIPFFSNQVYRAMKNKGAIDPEVIACNHNPADTWDSVLDYQMMSRNVRGFMSLFNADKPVVCKVHGFCVAGGTDMALCSDLLVIAEDAKIGSPEAKVTSSVTGGAFRLVQDLIGPGKARELLFTGDALKEAQAWVDGHDGELTENDKNFMARSWMVTPLLERFCLLG